MWSHREACARYPLWNCLQRGHKCKNRTRTTSASARGSRYPICDPRDSYQNNYKFSNTNSLREQPEGAEARVEPAMVRSLVPCDSLRRIPDTGLHPIPKSRTDGRVSVTVVFPVICLFSSGVSRGHRRVLLKRKVRGLRGTHAAYRHLHRWTLFLALGDTNFTLAN